MSMLDGFRNLLLESNITPDVVKDWLKPFDKDIELQDVTTFGDTPDTETSEEARKQEEEYKIEREREKQKIEEAKSKGASDEEAVRQSFTELKEPIGEGIWKVKAVKMYRPSGPMEVPGNSGFKDVCPGQAHVNRQIVEAKLEAGLPGTPVVPAMITQKGQIILADKHHTFVACMALGRAVKLALTSVAANPDAKADWGGCTWKGFEKPAAAGG